MKKTKTQLISEIEQIIDDLKIVGFIKDDTKSMLVYLNYYKLMNILKNINYFKNFLKTTNKNYKKNLYSSLV